VLDAGCGRGRNLVHFLREGISVLGADANPDAIAAVLDLVKTTVVHGQRSMSTRVVRRALELCKVRA
jgi:tellurite methyltransferase